MRAAIINPARAAAFVTFGFMTALTFRRAFADEPIAKQLINELDAGFLKLYPPEHMFGLHPNEERDPRLHFFIIETGDSVLGCGALRVLDVSCAELKRMYVRPEFRGLGVARKLIRHLEQTASALGISCMRLETGPEQIEALGLYRSEGYSDIPPYGEYVSSPVSVCMEKTL